ncbi:electron transport complex subunit RsxG [Candidatus Sororendozoicomonas aggregata]|uniref:electron transport complex subunit RsxG n=1 Tax=Candidatus Sororendozoicomonas aggregata TaxID=3073239 RepID=UPI002ED373FB
MSKTTPPSTDSPGKGLLTVISRSSISLGLFSLVTVGLTALTYVLTKDRIADQVRRYEARVLMEILPESTHDNRLQDTTVTVPPSSLLSTKKPQKAYIALKNGQAVAVILHATAPDGYNGRIDLLVGIRRNGTVAGVRVVSHKETPGLGDKIDTKVSPWIFSFTGKSLLNPTTDGWAVKKDGGQFDQFTGATITPRAVVSSVYRTLEYFKAHREQLLGDGTGY